MNCPIFILGIGRSGSVMLMNILNNHDDIFIDNEINFRFPYKKCVYSELKKIGDLKIDENANKIIDIIFNNEIPNAVPIYGEIKKSHFQEQFLNSDRNYKSFFELLIKLKKEKKKIWGAKFPVHFSYISMLLDWFSNSKIIFLVRDPRAVYHSELIAKKKYTSARQYPIGKKNPLFKLSVIIYVSVQWVWAQRLFFKYKENYNLYLLKYEALVSNPEKEMYNLCDFLQINYTKELLNIPVANSSFKEHVTKGFNTNAINRWQTEMNRFDKWLVSIITKKQRTKIGY